MQGWEKTMSNMIPPGSWIVLAVAIIVVLSVGLVWIYYYEKKADEKSADEVHKHKKALGCIVTALREFLEQYKVRNSTWLVTGPKWNHAFVPSDDDKTERLLEAAKRYGGIDLQKEKDDELAGGSHALPV